MQDKKHHLFLGFLSLVINIILPTLIFNYQTFATSIHDEKIIYGLLATLLILWLTTLFIALRELGGLVLHILNHKCSKEYPC